MYPLMTAVDSWDRFYGQASLRSPKSKITAAAVGFEPSSPGRMVS